MASDSESESMEGRSKTAPSARPHSLARLPDVDEASFGAYLADFAFTAEERRGLTDLFLAARAANEPDFAKLTVLGVVLCHFASLIPSNPGPWECVTRLLKYTQANALRLPDPLFPGWQGDAAERAQADAMMADAVFDAGRDARGRPLWCFDTTKFDHNWDHVLFARHFRRCIFAMLWDATRDEYDMNALRNGCVCYADMSGFSLKLVNRHFLTLVKGVGTQLPFQVHRIYIGRPPAVVGMFVKLLGTLLPARTMPKLLVVKKPAHLFQRGFATRAEAPLCTGGHKVFDAPAFLTRRGYL